MPWNRIDFNQQQFVNGEQNQLSFACYQLMQATGDVREAVILFRTVFGKEVFESFFLSPRAVKLLRDMVAPYNPVECEQPPKRFSDTWTDRIGFVAGDQQYFLQLYGTDL